MSDIIDCPALHHQAADYPVHFDARVPQTVRMIRTVEPDAFVRLVSPDYRGIMAVHGQMYPVWTNSHGAVAVVFSDGKKLGVMPDEFEVVLWYPRCPICHRGTNGGDGLCEPCAMDARAEIAALSSAQPSEAKP